MQFVSQIPLESLDEAEGHRDQTLLIFQCQNDPGLCDEWDPDAGGNAALLVKTLGHGAGQLHVPEGETLLDSELRLKRDWYPPAVGDEPEDAPYIAALDSLGIQLAGKLGGSPLWIQADETPLCECGASMRFVAQIEERGGINFGGGGAGYAFVCGTCRERAKFLWQC